MPARKKILIGFFLLLVTSGLYGLVFSPKSTLKEQRKLAELPAYKTHRLLKKSYYATLGKFLNDRYPYRSPLIIAKNWIDYNIFKTSPTAQSPTQVHIGTNGWFYLKNGMNDYFKNDCSKRKKALALAKKLHSIEKILKSTGKKFFFIVAPDKATIYPEHVRIERSPYACGKSFYDLFIEAIREYPVRGFIRLDNRLLEAKKKFRVYYKRGTHWTDRGAVIVSRIILERLSLTGRGPGFPAIRYRAGEATHDLARMFALPLSEKSDHAIVDFKNKTIKIQKLELLPNGNPHLKITAEAEQGYPLLPRAVIYRDSFMTKPLTMIDGSFAEINALWTHSLPLDEKLDTAPLRASKMVILEVVERNLGKLKINEKALVRAIGNGLQ